jgi:hypothetical protein
VERSSAKIFSHELACASKSKPTTVPTMTTYPKFCGLFLVLLVSISFTIKAGAPEQEKAFTDKYKKAFEGKDTATLESFLYIQGADPAIVEFYKMMQSAEAGEKISSIQLVDLTPEA